uniref:F-box domain-containing protein n=1 Tax=Panagrellus redivivus TaxID=6233 RepID=A0A7E4VIT3_PANRE
MSKNYLQIFENEVHSSKFVVSEWSLLLLKYSKVDVTNLPPNLCSTLLIELDSLKNRLKTHYYRLRATQLEWFNYVKQLPNSATTAERNSYHTADALNKFAYAGTIYKVMSDISCMKAKTFVSPIKFEKLPYEFQQRLVNLLPLSDVINFKLIGKAASKASQFRENCVDELVILHTMQSPTNIKKPILSPDFLTEKKTYHVKGRVELNFDSVEKYDLAIPLISGNYKLLTMKGTFSWHQVLQLMKKSDMLLDFVLKGELVIDPKDYSNFCNELLAFAVKFNSFVITCPNADHAFMAELKKVLKNHITHSFRVRFPRLVLFSRKRRFHEASDLTPNDHLAAMMCEFENSWNEE